MNFQKLMLIVVPLAVLIIGYQWFTRIDRTDAVQVGTAFTSAMKSGDVSSAGSYYVPDRAREWEETINRLKSGQIERMLELIPAEPAFTSAVTSPAGVTTIASADKAYTLVMEQVDGKWYVGKTP